MRVTEMVQRTFTVEHEVAICDRCGKREPCYGPEMANMLPDGWFSLRESPMMERSPDGTTLCSWQCVQEYAGAKRMIMASDAAA